MQHIVQIAFDFDDDTISNKSAFLEHKEEVISQAAKMLADSYRRTNAWKELAKETLDKENG